MKVRDLCMAKDLEKSKNGLDYSVTLEREREREKGGAKGMFQTGYSSFVLVPVIVVSKVEIAF